jgi:hypothetical protein
MALPDKDELYYFVELLIQVNHSALVQLPSQSVILID